VDAQAEPARTRGTALISLVDYLEKQHGAGAFRRVVQRLPDPHVAALGGIILPTDWYPTDAFILAIDGAAAQFGPPDFHERYGMAAADYQINAFYKFLLRFRTPGWLFDRGIKVWDAQQTSGKWQVERSERAIRGLLTEFAVVNAGYCRVLLGWVRRAAQITGAPEARVDHPRCRAAGAQGCLFTLEW
jgi:hypothetical protein